MKTSRIFLFFCWLAPAFAFSQAGLQFKLQLLEENKWGIFVRPMDNINPSLLTQVAAAQVTVVMPKDYAWNTLVSAHGTWTANSMVNGPMENPSKQYVGFGWVMEFPHVDLVKGQETLLLTFKGEGTCPDALYLFNNTNDPFLPPNSYAANFGNELTVFDPINGSIYDYHSNYSTSAWSCGDCDGDGILNAFEDTDGDGHYDANNEDTNGNGQLDPGEDDDGDGYLDPDVSDLNDPCDPGQFISANLSAVAGTEVICANDPDDIAFVKVDITGGTPPYEVSYTDGQDTFFVYNYHSGDNIPVVPSHSVQLQLVGIAESSACSQNTVLEGAANIAVHGPIAFNNHPISVVECAGNGTNFCVTTLNLGEGTINYQWQVNDGSGWADLPDGGGYSQTTTACLFIANVAGLHGHQYRCRISTSVCDVVYSNAALLEVEGPLAFTAQPQDAVNCAGEGVTFTASFGNGGTVGTMNSVWQYSNDGVNWLDLPNGAGPGGAVFGGATGSTSAQNGSSTLTLTNISPALDGAHFRLKVGTPECGFVHSNQARLNVEGPLTVTQQPTDFTNCSSNEAIFVADVSNPGYGEVHSQWQMSADGGNTWWDLEHLMDTIAGNPVLVGGYDADTLLLSPITGLDGYKVRQVYWTDSCTGGVTNWATLHVEGPIAFTDQPNDLFLANGESGSLSIGAAISNGTLVYKWQYSTIQGLWIDLPSNGVFSGTDTPTLQVNGMTPAFNGRYRCMVKSTNCDWEASDFAYLAVGSIVNITSSPQNTSTCGGVSACFDAAVEAINNNNPIWELQWQKKDAMGNWLDLNNDATYSGTHGLHFCINNPNATHNGQYRFRARTNDSNWTNSVMVSLSVDGPSFVQMPTSASVCSNKPHVFQASVSNAAGATLRWQRSTNGGASWATLLSNAGSNAPFNNGTYSGAYGQNLTLSNVEGMDGHRFRLVANDAQCTVTSNPVLLDVKDACQSTACDYDNDGIVNEQDPDYDNCGSACLKLKLQFLPNSNGWAVMAKPFGSFTPTASTMTTAGRVTIVAPAGFVLDGFESMGGTWSPINVEDNLPSYPGRKLITFELQDQQGVQVPYQVNQETPLFSFDKTGNCPDSLFILELVPLGFEPNVLTGEDNGYAGGFELCGVYARGNWNCQSPNGGGFPGGPGGSVPVVDFSAPDEGASERGVIANQAGTARFTASPNPACDFVNIQLEGELAEGNNTISLWDLQGKQRQTLELSEQTNVQLDLSGLPSGVYLVTLSQNGKVVQREKVVVR